MNVTLVESSRCAQACTSTINHLDPQGAEHGVSEADHFEQQAEPQNGVIPCSQGQQKSAQGVSRWLATKVPSALTRAQGCSALGDQSTKFPGPGPQPEMYTCTVATGLCMRAVVPTSQHTRVMSFVAQAGAIAAVACRFTCRCTAQSPAHQHTCQTQKRCGR